MNASVSAARMDAVPFRRSSGRPAEAPHRHLLLESKSLPRSGLHYMKRLFTRALGERFSFCEWYHEPDCCRKMPCTAAGACSGTDACGSARQASVRLVKSHDFELRDPTNTPAQGSMRVVLVRDPLYVLTSWYTLDCISRYAGRLTECGIEPREIWYRHDPERVAAAFEVIDACFTDPATEDLKTWLESKSTFITAFLHKWALPAVEHRIPGVEVVPYEGIAAFVGRVLVDSGRDAAAGVGHDAAFRPRVSPWSAPSRKLGDCLARNARLFQRFAWRVRGADRRMLIPALHGARED